MKRSQEVTIRTSTHAPHIAINKDCYINHNELIEYLKKSIQHAHKELDKEVSIIRDEKYDEDARFIYRMQEWYQKQLYGQLNMLYDTNCISEGQYKYYRNLIFKEIEVHVDTYAIELGI